MNLIKLFFPVPIRTYPTDNGQFEIQSNDTTLEIFKNLSNPSDLYNFALVCKKFEQVQNNYISTFAKNAIHLGLVTFNSGTLDVFKREINLTSSGNIETRQLFCEQVVKNLPKYHYFIIFAGPTDYFYAVKHTKNVVVHRSSSAKNYTLVDDGEEINFIKKNYKQVKVKLEL